MSQQLKPAPPQIKAILVVTNHNKLGDTNKQTGFYLPEVSHPYYIFKNRGYDVVFASIKGGLAEIDQNSVKSWQNHPPCKKFLKEFIQPNQGKYLRTEAISNLDITKYHVIFLVGGHGTMWDFPHDGHLQAACQKIYENGGVLAAVCHGPAGFLNLKDARNEYLIKGKEITGFSNAEEEAAGQTKVVPFLLEDEIRKRGAKYSCAGIGEEHVVMDDRFVTGQNPESSTACARTVTKLVSSLFFGRSEGSMEVLIVVTNRTHIGDTGKRTGWDLYEVAHSYFKFLESGYEVTFVSPEGGWVEADPHGVKECQKDEDAMKFYHDKCTDGKLQTINIGTVEPKNYHVILFTGRPGAMWDFPNNKNIQHAGEVIYNKGGILASICHGAAALVNMKNEKGDPLIKGKKLTAFSNEEETQIKLHNVVPFSLEDELVKKGASFSKGKPWECHVITDGNLITGQNPKSVHKVAEEIINALNKSTSQ